MRIIIIIRRAKIRDERSGLSDKISHSGDTPRDGSEDMRSPMGMLMVNLKWMIVREA